MRSPCQRNAFFIGTQQGKGEEKDFDGCQMPVDVGVLFFFRELIQKGLGFSHDSSSRALLQS